MSTFVPKSAVVEAEQYTGALAPIKKFLGIKDADYDAQTRALIIPTADESGEKPVAEVGDWVVKDATGAFSVCKPEEFEAKYGSQQ